MRLIGSMRVCRLLCISTDTLQKWRQIGLLTPEVTIWNEYHYTTASVDRLLASGARNFAALVTLDTLKSGRVVLLRPIQAARRLGVAVSTILKLTRRGQLDVLTIDTLPRITAQSVDAYIDILEDPERIERMTARRVLGLSQHVFQALVDEGKLKEVADPRSPRFRPISKTSLVDLLQEVLPSGHDPHDWLEDRMADPRELLRTEEATQLVGSKRLVKQLIATGQLPHLRTPGNHVRIAPDAIDAYLERQTPLTTAQLANIFGVTTTTIRAWLRQGQLRCTAHQDCAPELRRNCVLIILSQLLSPGVRPVPWYNAQMYGSMPLLTPGMAGDLLGLTPRQVIARAKSYKLLGLQHPTGSWRFARRHVLAMRRELQAAS